MDLLKKIIDLSDVYDEPSAMAEGGRIGFFEAGLVKQGKHKGKASIPYFNDGKTAYFKDLEKAKSAIEARKDKTSKFQKARTILKDPKLKNKFIKFANKPGVSVKDVLKEFNISQTELYESDLRKIIPKDFQLQAAKLLKTKTIDNMLLLHNHKEAKDFIRKGLIIPDEIIEKLGLNASEAATATVRLGQHYGGQNFNNKRLNKIRKNVKASDKLFESMNKFAFGNPYRSKLYQTSLELIDQQLGNEKGTFESLKKKASYILKKNKIKGFDINEIAGVTGTARTGVGEFSQFIDVMDSNLNQKQMASFQSAFSQARQNIMNNPNVFSEESKRINRLAGIFEREYGVKLPRIRALSEVEKFYSPKRLKELSDQGLDIKAASKRLGYTVQMPKGAITAKEFTQLDNKKLLKFFKDAGIPCIKGVGGNCTTPEDFKKGFNQLVEEGAEGSKQAIQKLGRFTKGMRALTGAAKWTGYGLLAEAGFMIPFAVGDYAAGESWKRILGNATNYGFGPIFGQSEQEEFEAALPEGSKAVEAEKAVELSKQLRALDEQTIRPQGRIGMDQARREKSRENVITGIEDKFKINLDPFLSDTPFAKDQWHQGMWTQAHQDAADARARIAKEKLKRLQKRRDEGVIAQEDWMVGGDTRGYMGGGIVGIRRPNAIPPERQGLRSIMIGDMND
jgi:hypothetical protein